MKIKACPACGLEVSQTCYHDGEDIPAVEMNIENAVKLTREYIVDMEEQVKLAKANLSKYQIQLMRYLIRLTSPNEITARCRLEE